MGASRRPAPERPSERDVPGLRWRPRGRKLASVLFPLLCAACASEPRAHTAEDRQEKSVLVGELLAIFPGFFVHGMGHRYAGNGDAADEILTMEVFSALTMGLGGGLLALGESEDADAVRVSGWIGIGVGAVPFLGTWIYDIVYTPSEIRRHNQRVRAAQ